MTRNRSPELIQMQSTNPAHTKKMLRSNRCHQLHKALKLIIDRNKRATKRASLLSILDDMKDARVISDFITISNDVFDIYPYPDMQCMRVKLTADTLVLVQTKTGEVIGSADDFADSNNGPRDTEA